MFELLVALSAAHAPVLAQKGVPTQSETGNIDAGASKAAHRHTFASIKFLTAFVAAAIS